jgi:CHASE3 domain sensor protein
MPSKLVAQPIRNLVFLGMLLPSISVSIAAIVAHWDHNRIRGSFSWITRTLQVKDTIHLLVADMVDVEDWQRGYLLTESRKFLEPYKAARERVSTTLKTLREQVRDNTNQQALLDKIDPLVADKLEAAAQTIELEQVGQHMSALKLMRADHNKKTIDAIRALADEMSAREEKQLSDLAHDLADQSQTNARMLFALLALNTLSIACILFLLQRLTRLGSLVKMCAWSKTIEYDGKWLSFEQYLEHRFNLDITHGISPTEYEKLVANLPPDSGAKN